MKRRFVFSLLLGLAGASGVTGQPVHFADANLKAAVEETLGVKDPNASEMLRLQSLDAPNRGIADLTGLEYAKNLTGIYLYGNQIADIRPLSGLTKLSLLRLWNNRISDIRPLAGLTNLADLDVQGNQISDVSALAGLTEMTQLWLATNPIADIQPLAGMTKLSYLYMPATQVVDISPLAGLTHLASLSLSGNPIRDISALSGMIELSELRLEKTQVRDIMPLAGLTGLERLLLSENQLEDISALKGLTNLEELWLPINRIHDISPLAGMKRLTLLVMYTNQIADISALAGLTELTELELAGNQIGDIAPLSGLTNLKELNLSYNSRISDMRPLAGLMGLTSLGLNGNQIADVGPLAGLTHLTNLQLAYNQIADVHPLAELVNLTGLNLDQNQITDVNPLAGLTRLISLNAGYGNQIEDISVVAGMVELQSLELRQNGIRDISPLAGLTRLTFADLSHNQIDDISPLQGLVNLRELRLYANQIQDLSPLASLKNLAILEAFLNRIADISPLSELTQLTSLILNTNRIGDISPLAGLTRLTQLDLGWNQIADAGPLAGLTQLTRLRLDLNEITDLRPLSGLTALTELGVGDNWITDIGPLAGLTRLQLLRLGNYDRSHYWPQKNLIEDLSILPAMTSLKNLDLEAIGITDLSIVLRLRGLKSLNLRGNPLDREALQAQIPQILANNPGIELLCDDLVWRVLTTTSTAGGSVVLPGEGRFQYVDGDVVAIEAVLARSSSRFSGWTGSAVNAGRVADPAAMKTTVLMDADYDLEAVFVEAASPATGFSLGELSIDDPLQFYEKIVTDNTAERTFVEYVAGAMPDPNGMMRMQPVDGVPAVAKGSFGRSQASLVLVRFSYLFERSSPGLELAVYLSDIPDLLEGADPRRAEHYVEVGRVPVPPEGRPGSVGSGRFGTFEQWVSTNGLDLNNGTWVQLELVESGAPLASASWTGAGIRLMTQDPDGGSTLVDNWAVEVHCDGICMDLNWSDTADEEDFLLVIASNGGLAGLTEGVGSRHCLDGAFSQDGYVDLFDVASWDWALKDACRCACGNFCRVPIPLTSAAAQEFIALLPPPSRPIESISATATLPDDLLVLGKRGHFNVMRDGFYSFAAAATYTGAYTHAALSDRCNLRLVREPSGQLNLVNSEAGVVQLSQSARTVIPIGQTDYASEPRYCRSATVYVGIQGASSNASGRPVLDVAFDAAGDAYVVPVVVEPVGSEPYVAAARLKLRRSSNPPYQVVQLYDDPPLPGDNQQRDYLREIEVDAAGNVYVVNVHALNESCILWKYDADGVLKRRIDLTGPSSPANIADPIALHVSHDGQMLYLASGQRDSQSPDSTKLYGLSTQDFSLVRSVTIGNMEQVTSVTEEPVTGCLWVTGVSMPEVPMYPSPADEPFYVPFLAKVPPQSGTADAVCIADPDRHDLALPTSIVWVGAGQ